MWDQLNSTKWEVYFIITSSPLNFQTQWLLTLSGETQFVHFRFPSLVFSLFIHSISFRSSSFYFSLFVLYFLSLVEDDCASLPVERIKLETVNLEIRL